VKAILDTHALIWAVDDPERMGTQARRILQDPSNERLFSSGSIWELAIKSGLGKLTLSRPFQNWIEQAVTDLQLTILPISIECAAAQSSLPTHHRDPLDRLLVAHALVESAAILSFDTVFDRSEIDRVW